MPRPPAWYRRRPTALALVTALLAILLPPPTAMAAAAAVPEVPKVLIGQDFPDPDILRVGDTWYAYSTNNSLHVPVASAPTIDGPWSMRGDAMPQGWHDGWSEYGYTWAPDVAANADGSFTLTYTARHTASGKQCIGVALANSPLGPFVPYGGQPLICTTSIGGAIDANTFLASNGTRWLMWKNDGNAIGQSSTLWVQQAVDNGARLIGTRYSMLSAPAGQVIEAPDIIERDGRYVLFYSGGDYGGCGYLTSYATSTNLGGPWTRAAQPLMTTGNTGLCGPGGADVVTEADGLTGGDKVVLHGWVGGARHMFSIDLSWVNGFPVQGGHRAASLDGNGRAEVAEILADGTVHAAQNYKGFATMPYSASLQIADKRHDPSRVRFADLNDDGRKEMIEIQANGEIHAWLNSGGFRANAFTTEIVIATGFFVPGRVKFADLDDDGRAELIEATENGTGDVKAWHNDLAFAAMPYGAQKLIADGFYVAARTFFADIDGDGRDEIIAVQDQPGHPVDAWHNDRGFVDRPYGDMVTIADGFDEPERVRFMDLDADGRDEIAAVQDTGDIQAWHNDEGFRIRPYGDSVIIGDGWDEPARTFFI
ncbi:glycoside hydrolase family 43 protein [Kribbella sp. NPDC056951]|uniref:glycoside hydrolase family 43 protein n=1 Tax=Kribbella sp. NPDC056951 TaxID=3345978 RepID=UPI0036423654